MQNTLQPKSALGIIATDIAAQNKNDGVGSIPPTDNLSQEAAQEEKQIFCGVLKKNIKNGEEEAKNREINKNDGYGRHRKLAVNQISVSQCHGTFIAFACDNKVHFLKLIEPCYSTKERISPFKADAEVLTCHLYCPNSANDVIFLVYGGKDNKIHVKKIRIGEDCDNVVCQFTTEFTDSCNVLMMGGTNSSGEMYILGGGYDNKISLFFCRENQALTEFEINLEWEIKLPGHLDAVSIYSKTETGEKFLAVGGRRMGGLFVFQIDSAFKVKEIGPSLQEFTNGYVKNKPMKANYSSTNEPRTEHATKFFTHETTVRAIDCDHKLKLLAWGGEDSRKLFMWEIGTTNVRESYVGFAIYTCKFSNDSEFICFGGATKTLYVRHVQTGTNIYEFADYKATVTCSSFLPGNLGVIGSSKCGLVVVRKIGSVENHDTYAQELKSEAKAAKYVCAIATGSGETILALSNGCLVHFTPELKETCNFLLGTIPKEVDAVGMAHDASYIAIHPKGKDKVQLFSQRTDKNSHEPPYWRSDQEFSANSQTYRIAFSMDNQYMMYDDVNILYIHTLFMNKVVKLEMEYSIWCSAFQPLTDEEGDKAGDKIIFAVGFGHKIQVFKLQSEYGQQNVARLFHGDHKDYCETCDFCYDGTRLITGSRDTWIRIWESDDAWENGKLLLQVQESSPVTGCSFYFNFDEKNLFASAHKDRRVNLWKIMPQVHEKCASQHTALKIWMEGFHEADEEEAGIVDVAFVPKKGVSPSKNDFHGVCLQVVTKTSLCKVNLISILELGPSVDCFMRSCAREEYEYICRTAKAFPYLLHVGHDTVFNYCIENDKEETLKLLLQEFPNASLSCYGSQNELGPLSAVCKVENASLLKILLQAAFHPKLRCYERMYLSHFLVKFISQYPLAVSEALKTLHLERYSDSATYVELKSPSYKFSKNWSPAWNKIDEKNEIVTLCPMFQERLKRNKFLFILVHLRSVLIAIGNLRSRVFSCTMKKEAIPKTKVSTCLIPMPFTTDEDALNSGCKIGYREVLQECVNASRKSSPEIFNNETVEILLDALWKTYFEQIFQMIFGVYAAVLGTCFFYSVLLGWEQKGGGLDIQKTLYGLDICMVILGFFNLTIETMQFCRNCQNYCSDYWNALHVVLYAFLLMTPICHLLDKTDATLCFSSISIVMAAFNTLFYFKGFRCMGGLVRMLEKIVTDLIWFLTVVVLTLLSFSAAFYSLFKDESIDGYRTYWETLLTSFKMMVGDFETDAFEEASSPQLMVCLFIAYMFLMAILLLNFIIAVLSETYEKVKESEKAQMLFEKANIILELYHFLSHEDQNFIDSFKWVHVIAPQDRAPKHDRSVTVKEVMDTTHSSINFLREESLHAMQDHKHAMIEELGKMKGEIDRNGKAVKETNLLLLQILDEFKKSKGKPSILKSMSLQN